MAGSLTLDETIGILNSFPEYTSIDTFVETGTLHGETVSKMRGIFPHCHTIELNEAFYRSASGYFSHTDIKFHLGDSVEVLRTLAPTLERPVFYFLDAHYSSGVTARGPKDCPVMEELEIIRQRPYRDLILIDDLRLFGTDGAEDWKHVTVDAVLGSFPCRAAYQMDDRLLLLR